MELARGMEEPPALLGTAAAKVGIRPALVATPLDEIPADATSPTFQRARYERQRAAASPAYP